MEARIFAATRPVAALAAVAMCFSAASTLHAAAGYRTTNFTVTAPTPKLAKEIGDAAEVWRKQLAMEWLGKELPRWAEPCPIKATVAPRLGAGGATSFVFDGGEVFGWRMNIQGSRERVLDSVLPHEITHTIFATHFRQPVPRWADEGACTTVEHHSEIAKQERMLIDFLKVRPGERGRGIPFDDMFYMTEYPQDVLPLYAQGHSLAVFLIGQKGKAAFLQFLSDGMRDGNWPRAVRENYGFQHLLALQNSWLDWVKSGRPTLMPSDGTLLAGGATSAGGTPATLASATVTPTPAAPDAAALSAAPTAASAAYADWSTRPARHTMNAAPEDAKNARR
jgi:hypothetical protein